MFSYIKNALSPDSKSKMASKKKAGTKKRAGSKTEAGRPKRAKTVPYLKAYDPEDFTLLKEVEGIKIIKGRGQKLGSFPELKASVEASKRTYDEIAVAHQFLFGKKAGLKLSKKEMKEHILAFSGYLKPIPSGKKRSDKEVDKEEEIAETKYSKRAFAMNKTQVLDLCKFFALDLHPTKDEPKLDKDTCIDRLLDFLGQPQIDWIDTGAEESSEKKKPVKKATPKTKVSATPNKATKSDYSKIKAVAGKGMMPSDEVLRSWVRAYIACFNMDKATTKHAIITCSEKFGLDLSKKKSYIKQMLAEEL